MSSIVIENYQPVWKADFIRLNTAWINKYFKIESSDIDSFSNIENWLKDGGVILFALLDNIAVGTVALKNCGNGEYELCKFAVDESCQGLGVGRKLLDAVLLKAKFLNARRVFLEGNTKLESSIHLYRKVGFQEVPDFHSHYERVDIVMELRLS